MLFNDSFEKIVQVYFACVTEESFEFKGKIYHPKNLTVSPLLLRTMRCPPNCGGCCFKFSLDYLPTEHKPDSVKNRIVIFNQKEFVLLSDTQIDNSSDRCQFLVQDNGRCGIHGKHPFTCQFETLRFKVSTDGPSNYLGNYPFGRGWSYKRTDGGRGALCIFNDLVTQKTIEKTVQRLESLKNWTDYFNLKTKIDQILERIQYRFKEPFIV